MNDEGIAPGTQVVKPDFVAPGEDIMSTVPGGWGEMSGTSMATPHVAASVALLHQADPALTADQLIATLKATADDIGTAGPDNQYGSGEIDVYRAVKSVLGAPPTTRVVKAPATLVTSGKVSFTLAGTGATAYRDRVDGGSWSAPQASPSISLSLAAGRHRCRCRRSRRTRTSRVATSPTRRASRRRSRSTARARRCTSPAHPRRPDGAHGEGLEPGLEGPLERDPLVGRPPRRDGRVQRALPRDRHGAGHTGGVATIRVASAIRIASASRG